MIELAGPAACSDFRLEQLLHRLRRQAPALTGLGARFVHYLDMDGDPGPALHEVLARLLDYGPVRPVPAGDGARLWVVPRLGTLSPWSSKATDILRLCGLHGVRRIERGVQYVLAGARPLGDAELAAVGAALHDRMTETVLTSPPAAAQLFGSHAPRPLRRVPVRAGGIAALRVANSEWGLALSDEELTYLAQRFAEAGRDPTDAELMMFAQANSEHCRHKIFNARWIIDGAEQEQTLFDLIRSTHAANPAGVLSAYRDNAAVVRGGEALRLHVDPRTQAYRARRETVHTLMKVETHNHPTAISPFPGAATGAGGEIRDEGATGRGARPKAGLVGFSVSHLRVPGWDQPWEARDPGRPDRIASPLQIMLEAPIGSAAFNNEFGRPNIAGYFRTFEAALDPAAGRAWGYHKPIMIAGGAGSVRDADVHKDEVPPGALLVVLGGPAMLIGLGGGAASSMGSGTSTAELDFASVQRGNPEMQRRAQEVIDACVGRGAAGGGNPIRIVHDVGAGGLSNALPELIDHSHRGGRIELREIPTAEAGMSPAEIWCNEAQERYVLALDPVDLEWFRAVCARERCPWAVVGTVDDGRTLLVTDRQLGDSPVEMPMDVLLGKPPRTVIDIRRSSPSVPEACFDGVDLRAACERVLRFPAVADKSFLIHIGDRTVGGHVTRDQLVGPWQVPVSDVGVTALGFDGYQGEALAMGERTPLAALDAAAAGRMAVTEALLNVFAADVTDVAEVRLSANWMAACGAPGQDQALREAVEAVAALCRELKVAIPVGKDSLSMRTAWRDAGAERSVVAPVSLIVSAFAPVADVRRTLTPQLQAGPATVLCLVDLAGGNERLGGSVLAQAHGIAGGPAPDAPSAAALRGFFAVLKSQRAADRVLAYHDRSDGGVFATVCEMAFAGRRGVDLDVPPDALSFLFNEEAGAVLQVRADDAPAVTAAFAAAGLGAHVIGRVTDADRVSFAFGGAVLVTFPRTQLHRAWSELSWRMQSLRDNPATAAQAWDGLTDASDPGLAPRLTYDPAGDVAAPFIATGLRPAVAILREQGVNSHVEMAAAFDRAGFAPVDVHMSDILAGRRGLGEFRGLVACGGFSYGDVLGAGGGWANSVLFNPRARDEFAAFFARGDTFTLGVCNGCQMLARLRDLIPGAEHWPRFVQNLSEQYEARLSQVEVLESASILLRGMAGSRLLIPTSHGEGRAEFAGAGDLAACLGSGRVAVRYVDGLGRPAETYPANPNGSAGGVAGFCSADGRATIMMPHPERVFRTVLHSWCPPGCGEDGPWMRLFRNARVWVG